MKTPSFDPTMAWPEPSPLTPHQSTYGTEPMTSKDNPRQPEPTYLRSDQRINDMAELLNMRRQRIDTLVAELATAQERIRVLEAENTKLLVWLNALAQRRDPPGGLVSMRLHTERLDRLEEQAEMADRNQQLMASRLARLEAWARQFPRTNIGEVHTNGAWLRGTNLIEPLDSMETKA